jgi:hypothetical protein
MLNLMLLSEAKKVVPNLVYPKTMDDPLGIVKMEICKPPYFETVKYNGMDILVKDGRPYFDRESCGG